MDVRNEERFPYGQEEENNAVDFAAQAGNSNEPYQDFELDSFVRSVEQYQTDLDEDCEAREKMRGIVKEIEKWIKKINFVLLDIHRDPTEGHLKLCAEKGLAIVCEMIQPLMGRLGEVVPKNHYYKYSDAMKYTFQRLATVVCLIHFLKEKALCSIKDCSKLMNVPTLLEKKAAGADLASSLLLDYDDYLVGLLETANELSRFSRNCITYNGSHERLYMIHKCLNQMNAGMHNITFRNDYLRKRYDGLKYQLKTVEEVVYDLKMREIEANLTKAGTQLPVPASDAAVEGAPCVDKAVDEVSTSGVGI